MARNEPGSAKRPRPGAVITATVAALPALWALGLGSFVWLLGGVGAALALLRRPRIRPVPYLTLWWLFLGFVAASAVQLDGGGSLSVWLLRLGWYLSAAMILLYVANDDGAMSATLKALFWLWVITICGGWLSLGLGGVSWSGPVAQLLPDVISESEYLQDLTNVRLSEVQEVRGTVFERPAAPFTYTNNWGSTLALLTPLGILAGISERTGVTRRASWLWAAAAVPPLLVSLNRGAWASLALGAVYALYRLARTGRRTPVVIFVTAAALGVAVALGTGVVAEIGQRLDVRSDDSTEARFALYGEAIEESLRSPVIGFGGPRESGSLDDGAPPVGTQGQLWMVLFSHGFPAAALYVTFFGVSFLRFDSESPERILAKSALLIGMAQLPIYGHLPQQLVIMMITVGVLGQMSERTYPDEVSADSRGDAASPARALANA